MKKLFFLILFFVVVVACTKEHEFPPKPTSSIVFAQESDSELLFDYQGATATVCFTSAKPWTAILEESEEKPWCNVTPAGGKGGDVTISVIVDENMTPDERKTTVVLKSGVTKKTITVNQKPSNSILLSPSTVDVEAKGGNYALIAKAAENCTVSVPDEYKTWISAEVTKSVSTTITYIVSENKDFESRTGKIIVSNSKTTEEVTINQAGASAEVSLSRTSFDCSEESTVFSVEVATNVPLNVSISEPWIERGEVNDSKYSFTVKANETMNIRTATISFENADYNVAEKVIVTQSGKKGDGSIRVLAIGNSFSDDAMEYLYQVLENAGYTSIKLGNLYIGGCTLSTHASNIITGARAYDYRVNIDGTWKTTSSFSSVDAISSDNWDFITMQQASGSSGMPDTFEPYLTTIIDNVKELCPDATLVWHQTWAYQQNSSHSEFSKYDKDQMTMYNAIINTVKSQILTENDIKFVIPSGTAIQNLRTSFIGDNLTRDGYHLSTGIGRYTAALMWAKQITGCNLSDVDWKPAGVVFTAKQLEAIKEAVNNAFDKPNDVTLSTILEDTEDINASLEAVIKAGGYNPDNYTRLQFDLIYPGYYNSASDIPMTVQTNMKNFATTRVFSKSEFPEGTLIVQKDGYGYRPEGWIAENMKNGSRPDNTNVQITEVDDLWWGNFTLRAFNIFKNGVSDLSLILNDVKDAFGIFIPKASNPELDKILMENGYSLSDYKMLDIRIMTYRYYNSSDKNMLSTPGSNMKNYAATEILEKSRIPNGTIIVQKAGYQYRPEGWTALDAVTSLRPANVTEQLVVVDDKWWGDFNYRAFNLAEESNPVLDDVRQEALKTAFGIYVPVK